MGEDDSSNVIKIFPVEYPLGNSWDEKGNTEIVQIFVSHGSVIDSIQFQYYAENGALLLSDRYGTNVCSNFDAVTLNYPSEYITWINVQEHSSRDWICSITIGTNLGEYGPIGKVQPANSVRDHTFRLGKDRQFGGFYGTADSTGVRAIGVYLKPNTTLLSSQRKVKLQLRGSIIGVFGHRSRLNELHSIGFNTDLGKYGPFGTCKAWDVEFSFQFGRGQCGGFLWHC